MKLFTVAASAVALAVSTSAMIIEPVQDAEVLAARNVILDCNKHVKTDYWVKAITVDDAKKVCEVFLAACPGGMGTNSVCPDKETPKDGKIKVRCNVAARGMTYTHAILSSNTKVFRKPTGKSFAKKNGGAYKPKLYCAPGSH